MVEGSVSHALPREIVTRTGDMKTTRNQMPAQRHGRMNKPTNALMPHPPLPPPSVSLCLCVRSPCLARFLCLARFPCLARFLPPAVLSALCLPAKTHADVTADQVNAAIKNGVA